MKSGLVIYAQQLQSLVDFYSNVFGFSIREADDSYAALEAGDFELVILETNESRKAAASGQSPRTSVPLKPVFFVEEAIESIRRKVETHKGHLNDPKNQPFNGAVICDGWDPEGNIFQVRIG